MKDVTFALFFRLVIANGLSLNVQILSIYQHKPAGVPGFPHHSHFVDLQISSLRLLGFDFSLESPPEVIPPASSRPGDVRGIDECKRARSVLLQQALQLTKQILHVARRSVRKD